METGNFVEIATGVTQTSYTLPGLLENTSYQLRVRARNSVGYGDYSSVLSIATLMGTIGTIKKVYGDGDIIINGIEMIVASKIKWGRLDSNINHHNGYTNSE